MKFAVGSSNNEIGSLLQKNGGLVRNIFILLIVQLLITGLVAHFTISKKTKKSTSSMSGREVGLAILMFMAVFVIAWLMVSIIMDETKNPALRIFLFTIISVLMGLSLSYVKTLPAKVVAMATLGTITAFVVMGAIGYYIASKNINLRPMEIWLFAGLIILIIASIVIWFAFPDEPIARRVITALFVCLFSLYIMYDTNQILMNQIDYIGGAFSYYIDIINIFEDLLYLMSDNS
jgi:FtsH-binding integral membrane protein